MRKKKKAPKLDVTDRLSIEIGLSKGENFRVIASKINCHPTTISREILANRTYVHSEYPFGTDCKLVRFCDITSLCDEQPSCRRQCRSCYKTCSDFCPDYTPSACHKHEKPPFVCNNCSQRKTCMHSKYFYSSKRAQLMAERRRSDSRKGLQITGEELKEMDDLLLKLIKKNQPISHICATNKEKIPVSERSIYNYISAGKLKVKLLDLRRQAGYKKRKKENVKTSDKPNPTYRRDRTYEDFKAYMEGKDESAVVEMDTVKGRKGTTTSLLTMLFRKNNITLIFLMPDCTQRSVIRIFDYLETGLGEDRFRRLFPVILTDNGGEFKNVDGLELTSELTVRTKVFYCDPMASWQKAKCEKNHEYIRYVIPKGTDLGSFTNDDITLLMNHINSTVRKSLSWNSPYDMVSKKDVDMLALMKLLGLEQIPYQEVELSPKLLR